MPLSLMSCLSRSVVLALAVLLLSCTPATPPNDAPRGYLHTDDIPDSLALSPPPPAPGSLWAKLDETVAVNALALHNTPRFEQAHVDAEMTFPASAEHFVCALGVSVDAEHTPVLYRLLERTRRDAGAATGGAKHHYQRPRPFMLNGQPTCSPEHEELLRSNGSYPSGHTSAGWVWALILAEIAPERTPEIIQRGRNYGQSRLVCNVHWYSDVIQGQAMAAATVARLHGNPEFLDDLGKARAEIIQARAAARPLPRDCAAEAAALAIPIPGVR